MKKLDLLKALKYTFPGIDPNLEGMGGSELVTFFPRYVRSLNQEVSAVCFIETGLDNVSVNANYLLKILSKLPGEELDLKKLDNELVIRSQKAVLKLQIFEKTSFFDFLDIPKEKEFVKLPDNFLDNLKLAAFSASRDSNDGVLNGVYFEDSKIIATDRFRLSVVKFDDFNFYESFLISLSSVLTVLKMGSEIVKYYLKKPWVHFYSKEGLIISFMLINGEYPSEKIFEILEANVGEKYVFPNGLSEIINRAEILSFNDENGDNGDNYIKLYRKGNNLIVLGRRDAGEYKERIEWKSKFDENLVININPQSLKEILNYSNNFYLNKNKSAVTFYTDNFKHMLVIRCSE